MSATVSISSVSREFWGGFVTLLVGGLWLAFRNGTQLRHAVGAMWLACIPVWWLYWVANGGFCDAECGRDYSTLRALCEGWLALTVVATAIALARAASRSRAAHAAESAPGPPA